MESFLIDLFVRSLAVLAAVGATLWGARRMSAATRSLVWRLGIGLLLALPVMMVLLPKWTLAWLPAAPESTVAYGTPAMPPAAEPFSWLAALYAVGVVVGLARLAASFAAAALITNRGVVVERTRRYRVVLSKEAPMPFAFGLRRPSVVLPAAALDWDPAVRDDVLAHEVAHVVRHDWLWLLLGRIAAVMYWPNPGVAWMLHRARLDSEMAADDQVLLAGQDQVRYAEHLVRVARACQSTALLAPMAAEPPLTTRLRSLLSGEVRRNAPGRPASHAMLVMGLLLIGPMAAMGLGPREEAPSETRTVNEVSVPVQPAQMAAQVVAPMPPAEVAITERVEATERTVERRQTVRRRPRATAPAPHPLPEPPIAVGTPVPDVPATDSEQTVPSEVTTADEAVAPAEAVEIRGGEATTAPTQDSQPSIQVSGTIEQTRTSLPRQRNLSSLD